MNETLTTIFSTVAIIVSILGYLESRDAKKAAIRIGLYESRRAIWRACHEAILFGMQSLPFVKPVPFSCTKEGREMMERLVDAAWESERVLTSVAPEIAELNQKMQRINQLQIMISAEMYPGATEEEIKENEVSVLRYMKDLQKIKDTFYEEYGVGGVFDNKLKSALVINE